VREWQQYMGQHVFKGEPICYLKFFMGVEEIVGGFGNSATGNFPRKWRAIDLPSEVNNWVALRPCFCRLSTSSGFEVNSPGLVPGLGTGASDMRFKS